MVGDRFSRRYFFYGALLAGSIPRGGFGSQASLNKMLGFKSPNEKLNIAAIGAGGRGAANIAGCASENIVALADPDDLRAAETFKRYEKAARYRDFRRMLDKEGKTIDAVIISAPDHVHGVATYWSMERGKHVFVEKPLARTPWECRLLTEAAAKFEVATQMGNQGYSTEGVRVASEILWSGEIGEVREVHAWTDRPIWPQGIDQLPQPEKPPETLDWDLWLGPAASRPYSSAYLPFNWRGWFDFGCGAIGDGACHSMGAANMALLLSTVAPTRVEVVRQEGRNRYTFPNRSVIRYDFPARGALPPVRIFWYDGITEPPYRPPDIPESEPFLAGPGAFGARGATMSGGGVVPAAQGGRAPAVSAGGARLGGGPPVYSLGNGSVFVGEKGYLTADGYGANVRLLPESRHNAYKLPPPLLARSPGHYQDWIRACKGLSPEPCSSFSVAGPFAEWTSLGMIALHFEGPLEWDGAAMRFTNNPEANKYVKPEFRKGWEIG